MIYITGDTHGNHTGYKLYAFAEANPQLTRADFLIICGDFGFIWDSNDDEDLDKLSKLNYTILFVDGNHENFDRLYRYPIEKWKGGKVHRIRDNILHLMRGEVFNINSSVVFAFGGAESTDKNKRIEGLSWWPQEVPSDTEFESAKANLKAAGNNVDYIITHAINTGNLPQQGARIQATKTTEMLEWFEQNVEYGAWFFGHYHRDIEVATNKRNLYHSIVEII